MNDCKNCNRREIRDKLLNSSEFSQNVEKSSSVFALLGDASRMKIILALMEGELCVYHICEIVGLKQSATSQHLRKLKDNGILKCRKDGNQVLYSLQDQHVKTIIGTMIEHFSCN